ncbi:uncharacterized protein EAE97_002676 [Botrytis byssoidea]|uniref:Uncharacterized protein n=1 Tax=Botrytis byssoidea TaxID=139641 RepID=A0A9P5M8W6_9HELO|nr:uncharacterized protein EAE97_002676 [Botrytis byssoidea]KAF7951125.1 hypothetical protein EAE97_002676 [Botrytis byssoidea]
MFGNPRVKESKALHKNAPGVPPRYSSQDENMQSMGVVEHEDRLREVDSWSPIPFLSSSASPVPLSSGQNDDLQGTDRSSKVILHESCLVKGAPSCDKAKAKFDELGKDFPSDLPYIITYENRSLEAKCQECGRRLKIEGSAIGGIINHATGTPHGFNVKQRLDSNNLEETLTSKVMARRKAMENSSVPNPFREVPNRRKFENIEPLDLSSIEVDPAGPVNHSGSEPRKSKRRKVASAFPAEIDTSDLRISTGLKNPVGRPRGWKKNKISSSISETSAPALERTVADISERLTDIDHQFDYKIKKQRDQTLLFNADLIGLRNFYGKRLDTLEQTSETQKHELKLCNANFKDSKAQTDASFHKDKISLANMESALGKQKDLIDNLSKLLSNAECTLRDQKKVMNTLANSFPDMECELNEQKEIVSLLASKTESDLKGQKETTTNFAELMDNRLTGQKRKVDHLMQQLKNLNDGGGSIDLLRLQTEDELQNHQKQIANLEQKISRIRYDATKEVSEIIKKQNFPRIYVDRVEKMENSIEELNKKSEGSFPAKTSEAIIDRVVGYTAENHNTLEEMVRGVDKRHSYQRESFIEALETKISCTSQAAIDRVADLEGSSKEFQTKLTGMAGLAVEPQLQRCKQYAELLEKQAVEFRPYMDRIVRLEDNISEFRTFKNKLDSLETCTQGFQKWLDEMACESGEYRLQQDSLRTEFLKRQALESQAFVERIVNLEKRTTDKTRLMEENKVSAEPMRKCMLNFRYTSDQIAQLRKEVQSYDSKLGAVSAALDNRRLQQLKEHTELIEERVSHIQTDFDNMVTRFAAEAQNIATQAARFEVTGENSSRDRQIDDLAQSIRPIMLRLAGLESTEKQSDKMVMMRLGALEKNEKQSDDMMMLRLAALEEKNERQVSRILELERGNQSLQREVMKLQQPNLG